MSKQEIAQVIDDIFKGIVKSFRKSMQGFEPDDIQRFRTEVKRLKVFLHLLNMESEDGFSYRITRRLKTIYGYQGIIRNIQSQISEINFFVKEHSGVNSVYYIDELRKELAFWKKLSADYLHDVYDFEADKMNLLSELPDRLTDLSIQNFIHYTLHELQSPSGNSDDYILGNTRKFIEDLYYNDEFIRPLADKQKLFLPDNNELQVCMELLLAFRKNCIALDMLQSFDWNKANKEDRLLINQLENKWMGEKNELKKRLSDKLNSGSIRKFKLTDSECTDSMKG